MSDTLSNPVRWMPDGLFYQARALEPRGADTAAAQARVFQGAPGAHLRQIDPTRSGDPEWVAYNAQFYERRITVPAAAAALEPAAGDRAILDISGAGYVAAVLAIFGLLLLRFRLPVATVVALATIALPGAQPQRKLPLTDSWGVAFETAAVAFAILALDRGPRWVIGVGGRRPAARVHTRQRARARPRGRMARLQAEVEGFVLAAGHLPPPRRSPVMLIFAMPMRELLAMMLNDAQPDTRCVLVRDRAAVSPTRSSTCSRRTAATSATAHGSPPPTCSPAWPCCSRSAAAPASLSFLKAGSDRGRPVRHRRADLQWAAARARARADGRIRTRARGRARGRPVGAPRMGRPAVSTAPDGHATHP